MLFKFLAATFIPVFFFFSAIAQSSKTVVPQVKNIQRPKLVVGLVIDQMRWDYLYRYYDRFGKNGFKRLMGEGFNSENMLISHIPTYTAVGHSGAYTGTVPAISGIVGNYWYDKKLGRTVYCSEDSTVSTIGSKSQAGKMSPRNMWTSSIADELRLSNNFKGKTIGIALKDRGAIFPAGHSANAAYWFDDNEGNWISSSFYMPQLPDWVTAFNNMGYPDKLLTGVWNNLLAIESYSMSTKDDVPYEGTFSTQKTTYFPHHLTYKKAEDKYEPLRFTPFGNTFTFDFAKEAIINEGLGKDSYTDFLAVSLSSTDYIGHVYGPNSMEVEDTYIRLDKDIAAFLQYLDQTVGKGQYLFFLTADHGAAHIPGFLNEHNIPAGSFSERGLSKTINAAIERDYGITNAVLKFDNYQLYLNEVAVKAAGKDFSDIKKTVTELLMNEDYITQVIDMDEINEANVPEPLKAMIQNGYCAKRSGDLQILVKPNYFDGPNTGTTHGVWNAYDAHIPMLWFGWGIKKGTSFREVHMTDIAPTLAALLKIQAPNGNVGKVITELIR